MKFLILAIALTSCAVNGRRLKEKERTRDVGIHKKHKTDCKRVDSTESTLIASRCENREAICYVISGSLACKWKVD